MAEALNRRQWERLQLTEDAFAVDSQGQRLGKISHAGGGGMLIRGVDEGGRNRLPTGGKVRITIVEPNASTSHVIDVIVRYHSGDAVGAEFVTGEDR